MTLQENWDATLASRAFSEPSAALFPELRVGFAGDREITARVE